MAINKLQGTFTALITPFTDDGENIDYEHLRKIIQFQIEQDIEGLVPCGTTGESPTLSIKEHEKIIDKTVEWAKSYSRKTIIIAGAGSNSTKEAVALSKSAQKSGADYILSVNPYYNKPNQIGLIKHFSRIADSVDIPIILYNIPGRTNVQISLESMQVLAEHANIVGVKEATGDIHFIANTVVQTSPHNFVVLSGDDNLILPVLSVGGCGVISVASNIYPKLVGDISRLYEKGEIAKAKEIFLNMLDFFSSLFVETNPIPVKYIASLLSLCRNILRSPLVPIPETHKNNIQKIMSRISNT